MQTRTWLTTLALTWLAAAAFPRSAAAPDVDAAAVFERLKSLQGTWESVSPSGSKATSTFELVGNGTVLLERYTNTAMPGEGRMVSAYHLDGATLLLTHYCIAKNQPTLRADRYEAATGTVQFEFLRATSLPSESAGHMRRAMYRLEGPDQFTTEWDFFQNGKKTMTEKATFTRVK